MERLHKKTDRGRPASSAFSVAVLIFAVAGFACFAALSQSNSAQYLRFDWSWKVLKKTGALPPPEAPFWSSQEDYEFSLRKRGIFVIHAEDALVAVQGDAVEAYFSLALVDLDTAGREFQPPPLLGHPMQPAGFSVLLDSFLEWAEKRPRFFGKNGGVAGEPIDHDGEAVAPPRDRTTTTPRALAPSEGEDGVAADGPIDDGGEAMQPAPAPGTADLARRLLTTRLLTTPDARRLQVITTSKAPAPDSTTPIPPDTTTTIIDGTTPSGGGVTPAWYDSCDWSERPDAPTCDSGFNACGDSQCDGTQPSMFNIDVCVCTEAEWKTSKCIFFQCDTDGDTVKDTCILDSNGDGLYDEEDTNCGLRDANNDPIPNSVQVCAVYASVCSAFPCHCSQDCKSFNDCCPNFDVFCAVCSCGPYADDCCCAIGQYNADCNGLQGYCNCLECTCDAGKYFITASVTDSCVQRSCAPADCPAGQYLNGCECEVGTVSVKPGTCEPCITSCSVGQYMDGACDGTTLTDVKVCADCTASGACPDKHYYDSTRCQGDTTEDDSCVPCTTLGNCAEGFFYDDSQCPGDGFADTTCQSCTASGNCPSGEYFKESNCQGDTDEDDSCVACTTSGNCASRRYFEADKCQGDGTSDDTCVKCTLLGACPDNTFWNAQFCVGTGTTDDQCRPCTALGDCPDDFYFSGAACDGSGFKDSSCVECTEVGACASGWYHDADECALGEGDIDSCKLCTTTGNCPDDFFFNTDNCDGTGTLDDSCEVCTTLGNCAVGFYFDATICADGESDEDSCVQCATSCASGFFYDSTKCQGDGAEDDTCVECSSVIDHCATCTTGTMCNTCDAGYTPITNAWLGLALADGTVVVNTDPDVYGQCLDVTPPVLTNCPPDPKIVADPFTQTFFAHWEGVELDLPLSAEDFLEGTIALVCVPYDSGDAVGNFTHPVDDFFANCTATDSASNVASCSFFVEIADTTPPTFTGCPANIEVIADYGSATAAATWTPPTAFDDVDGNVQVYSSEFPGDEFFVGNHAVKYYAVDLSNNAANCVFYVSVEFVGTTTPDPFGQGMGEATPEPKEDSSDIVEDAVDDISESEHLADRVQDSDSDGLGVIVSSTRTATSLIYLTFDSFCSDPDKPVDPDTSDLSIVGGIVEAMLDELGLVASSVQLKEQCAAVDVVTLLEIHFSGDTAGDPAYDDLEAEIAAAVASTLGVPERDVVVAVSIGNKPVLTLRVTTEARVLNTDLLDIISDVNANTDVGSYQLAAASTVVASEVTVFNDMAQDVTVHLKGTYDDVSDYSDLEAAVIAAMANELGIHADDITVITGVDSSDVLVLRVVTAGYDGRTHSAALQRVLDQTVVDEGFDGVRDITNVRLVSSEVYIPFVGNQTNGADFSVLEAEIVAAVAAELGATAKAVMVEEAIVNSRIVLLIYSQAALTSANAVAVFGAVNRDTDVANTELVNGDSITVKQLSATAQDSRNQLEFTITGEDYVSEQITLSDLLEMINTESVLAEYVNQDNQPVGSARAGCVRAWFGLFHCFVARLWRSWMHG
jgi:hypothetical protein